MPPDASPLESGLGPGPEAAAAASGPGPSPDSSGDASGGKDAELLINGELKPLAEILGSNQFGTFSGFRHPNGVDMAGGSGGDATAPPPGGHPDGGVLAAGAVQTA